MAGRAEARHESAPTLAATLLLAVVAGCSTGTATHQQSATSPSKPTGAALPPGLSLFDDGSLAFVEGDGTGFVLSGPLSACVTAPPLPAGRWGPFTSVPVPYPAVARGCRLGPYPSPPARTVSQATWQQLARERSCPGLVPELQLPERLTGAAGEDLCTQLHGAGWTYPDRHFVDLMSSEASVALGSVLGTDRSGPPVLLRTLWAWTFAYDSDGKRGEIDLSRIAFAQPDDRRIGYAAAGMLAPRCVFPYSGTLPQPPPPPPKSACLR